MLNLPLLFLLEKIFTLRVFIYLEIIALYQFKNARLIENTNGTYSLSFFLSLICFFLLPLKYFFFHELKIYKIHVKILNQNLL